jgi:hypothetical protein
MVWPWGSRTDGLKVTYTRAFTSAYFRKSKLAEQTLLQIGGLRGTPFGFLRRRESAHERQHLHVMGVNVDKRRTLFAAASDRPAAIHIRVESGMARALSTPSDAADLEHPFYYPDTITGAREPAQQSAELEAKTRD